MLLPLSLHILLDPIFLCFFHAYDHFACCCGVTDFFFPSLSIIAQILLVPFVVFHANDHLGSQLLCGGVS